MLRAPASSRHAGWPGELKQPRLCPQVATVGKDGAVHIVALAHTGAPPGAFVRAHASVSMRAVAWASQQTLVTAGTTGEPLDSIRIPGRNVPFTIPDLYVPRCHVRLDFLLSLQPGHVVSWPGCSACQCLYPSMEERPLLSPACPGNAWFGALSGLILGKAVSGCGRQCISDAPCGPAQAAWRFGIGGRAAQRPRSARRWGGAPLGAPRCGGSRCAFQQHGTMRDSHAQVAV